MLRQGLDKVCAMTNRKKKRIGQSGPIRNQEHSLLFERISKNPGICTYYTARYRFLEQPYLTVNDWGVPLLIVTAAPTGAKVLVPVLGPA